MTRGQTRNNKRKDKRKLSQTPAYLKETDGEYVEYSEELADLDDLVAQRRAQEVEERDSH